MKIKINSKGQVEILRSNGQVWVKQWCMHHPDRRCCDGCPLFEEYNEGLQNTYVAFNCGMSQVAEDHEVLEKEPRKGATT